MPPLIPPEMINGAIQLAVYFITAVGVVLGLLLSGRSA